MEEKAGREDVVGRESWKRKLEDKVGRASWKRKLEEKVGRESCKLSWKRRLEEKVGRECWKKNRVGPGSVEEKLPSSDIARSLQDLRGKAKEAKYFILGQYLAGNQSYTCQTGFQTFSNVFVCFRYRVEAFPGGTHTSHVHKLLNVYNRHINVISLHSRS